MESPSFTRGPRPFLLYVCGTVLVLTIVLLMMRSHYWFTNDNGTMSFNELFYSLIVIAYVSLVGTVWGMVRVFVNHDAPTVCHPNE